MAFPFAALRFLQKPAWRTVLILGLTYGSLLTTLCRGAWVGLFVGFLLFLFCYPAKKNLLAMIAVMLAVTAILMPARDWRLLRRLGSASSEIEMALSGDTEAGSARFLLWQESLSALSRAPLVGVGPDALLYVSQEKFERRFGKGIAIKAHNIYLEIAATMGIPALLMYLWFLGRIVSKTDRRDPLQFSFFAMVVIYLVRGFFLVDVITVYPLFWLLLGFYQGTKSLEPAARGS